MPQVKNLKALPRAPRPLTGSGALPSKENLIQLSPEQLTATLRRFNLEPDVKAIEKRALRAFDRLERAIQGGHVPDESTWEAIDKDIERQVTETMRQQVKAAIRNYERARFQATGARLFVWITVGDENVCPSCEPRHGQVEPMKVWDRLGPPGSGALLCSTECRCRLQPVFDEASNP